MKLTPDRRSSDRLTSRLKELSLVGNGSTGLGELNQSNRWRFRIIHQRPIPNVGEAFAAWLEVIKEEPAVRFFALSLGVGCVYLCVEEPNGTVEVIGGIAAIMYVPPDDGHLTAVPDQFLTVVGHL